MLVLAALVFAAAAFTLSASAGLGGSLILVPAMSLLLGTKEGIALAALMLGANNVAKVLAYRRTVPLRGALAVLVLTVLGAALGARLLVEAPERWVSVAVIASFVTALIFERMRMERMQSVAAPALAFGAGATSGFSGTSGPLKGVAIRNLRFDRLHFVGAASAVSLVNDLTKSAIYAEASLLTGTSLVVLLASLPLMPLATLTGRRINSRLGERAFAYLFWVVMGGYTLRLILRS
jgi:uncharacterized protein